MGRFNDFAKGGGLEIEVVGSNPPDVQGLIEAPCDSDRDAFQSCSGGTGAAITPIIK